MPAEAWTEKLIGAAKAQIGVTLVYDPQYTKIADPGGDVQRSVGVCTDVVIRAYRDGLSVDLQKLVHEDMQRAFSSYPDNWGLKRPDSNIDHRRVPNLRTFFKRRDAAPPIGTGATIIARAIWSPRPSTETSPISLSFQMK